jgi:S-adenosylmethionine hydrolase
MSDMPSSSLIALITDFGESDPFVGIMKGVISKISPGIKFIDITHNIPPGDIQRAAVMLWQSKPYFPPGSIFLTVVDPGVGTSRRGLIGYSYDHIYIGPDNGLFTFVLDESSGQWELENQKYQLPHPGTTFHGRDIFAPAAAYTAKGIFGSEFGSVVTDILRLPKPHFRLSPHQIQGEILYHDRFGNLLTSLGKFISSDKMIFEIEPWLDVEPKLSEQISISRDQASMKLADGRILSWVDTFADLLDGECGILVGSSGLLEISANQNSAADLLNLPSGEHVTLNF